MTRKHNTGRNVGRKIKMTRKRNTGRNSLKERVHESRGGDLIHPFRCRHKIGTRWGKWEKVVMDLGVEGPTMNVFHFPFGGSIRIAQVKRCKEDFGYGGRKNCIGEKACCSWVLLWCSHYAGGTIGKIPFAFDAANESTKYSVDD